MSRESIEFLKEYKCAEKGCFNYRMDGFVFCVNHMYGFPHLMDKEDIDKLKEIGAE